MMLWLAFGCPPSPSNDEESAAAPPSILASPAFDPLGGVPLTWAIQGDESLADVAGSILAADGTVVRARVAPEAGWDGKTDGGAWAPTGDYALHVGNGNKVGDHPFALIRAGVMAAYAEDDAGTTAERLPLYWSMKRHSQAVEDPFSQVASLDDGAGHRVDLPGLGESLLLPDDVAAEPLAYTYDSRPMLALTLGDTGAFGAANLEGAELHVVVTGWTVLDDTALADGGTVTIQRDAPLGTTLGVTEEALQIGVEAVDAEGVRWPVATIPMPWRVYRVLDAPTWDEEDGERYDPWVAAIDPALRAIEGTEPVRERALDALVRWVFEDGGLAYDTEYGASAYTTYVQGDWNRANFDMTSFLARKYGMIVNCTDCAGIIVGFGNMLGAHVDYAIIGWDFDLNYILAIGGTEYDHCPFGGRGCGFSYHAVTTNTDNDLIWDATLALDGDDDPGSAPHTELLVQSIPADEYLDRLAKTRAGYVYQAQGTLQ